MLVETVSLMWFHLLVAGMWTLYNELCLSQIHITWNEKKQYN